MGVFDVFGKKKEAAEEKADETITLAIDSVIGWANKELRGELNSAVSKANEMQDSIMGGFCRLTDSIKILENASFEEHDRKYAAVNMVKDSFTKKAHSVMKNARRIRGDPSYTALTDFYSSTLKVINELKDLSPKQMVLLSKYFKKECSNFISNMKEIENSMASMKRFLDSDAAVIRIVEDLNASINRQSVFLRDIESAGRRLVDIQKKLGDMRKAKSENEAILQKYMNSKEWKDLECARKDIEDMRQGMQRIENTVNERIYPLKRPFKKIKHALKGGAEKEPFPDNPFTELIMEDREIWLRNVLNSMKGLSEKGAISLKARESEKVSALANALESEIPNLKERYIKLSSTVGEKEKELKTDIEKKVRMLEGSMKDTAEEISHIENEAKEIMDHKEKMKGGLIEEKEKTEKLILEGTGRKVRIGFSG